MLEHYARCPCIRRFARSFLNIKHDPQDTQGGQLLVLGLNLGTVSDEMLVRRAICTYAAYNAFNDMSHGFQMDQQGIQELLKQHAREAVRGHSTSTAILEGSFQADIIVPQVRPHNASMEEWEFD